MNRYGIEVSLKNVPELDPAFCPMGRYNQAFLAGAKQPISLAVERADGQMAAVHTYIHGTPEMAEADRYYIDRLVKTILWMKGGFRVYTDSAEMAAFLQGIYAPGGKQDFYDSLKQLVPYQLQNNAFPGIIRHQVFAHGGIVIKIRNCPYQKQGRRDIIPFGDFLHPQPSILYPALMTVLMHSAQSPNFSRRRLMWVSTARASPS